MKELQELAQKRFDELTKQKTEIEAEMKPLREYLNLKGAMATPKRGRKAGEKVGAVSEEN
jgi:hypothetical protein